MLTFGSNEYNFLNWSMDFQNLKIHRKLKFNGRGSKMSQECQAAPPPFHCRPYRIGWVLYFLKTLLCYKTFSGLWEFLHFQNPLFQLNVMIKFRKFTNKLFLVSKDSLKELWIEIIRLIFWYLSHPFNIWDSRKYKIQGLKYLANTSDMP